MSVNRRNWGWVSACGLIALLMATAVDAANKTAANGKTDSQAETVEMFAAIEKGDIAVKMVQKDSTQCTLRIENKTQRPLSVKLPDAFAGVPVLAQTSGRRGTGGNNRSSGGNQGTGGGMSGMGGGGMFNVPAEKVGKLVVPTVCLEHGKAEPRPSVQYEIRPIETFTTKTGVRELCQMFGAGKLDQRAAQAAAWHLNSGMSWEELAEKRIRHLGGQSEPYFTQAQLDSAKSIAATAVRTAKEREEKDQDDDSISASGKQPTESK